MKSQVFNNNIGSPYSFNYPKLTPEQEKQILAGLFEQLLIFDQITISTNRVNFALAFLIKNVGLKNVERLLESGYIKLMIWSPVLVTGTGKQLEDGTIDQSVIYGQPPIGAGTLSDEDLDAEKNIHYALSNFNLGKDYKRKFTKKAIKNYLIPNGMEISTNSEKLVVDAYLKNNLSELGLPFSKDPNQLDPNERNLLLQLGHKVIETSILSKYGLKSYENFEHFEICKQNFSNIGKAFNIANNTTEIFKIENLPNLKELFLNENLDFETVFKIKHLSSAKYFRKWINEVGENSNSYEVTSDYLNQIKGNSKFFESTKGKFLKNLGLFGVTTGIGAIIGGQIGAPVGTVVGKVVEPAVDYGLGLLETYWLDDLLKGKNPSMFIENIKTAQKNGI
jgi:hypothetical protein